LGTDKDQWTRDIRSIDFNEDFKFVEGAKINTISRETIP